MTDRAPCFLSHRVKDETPSSFTLPFPPLPFPPPTEHHHGRSRSVLPGRLQPGTIAPRIGKVRIAPAPALGRNLGLPLRPVRTHTPDRPSARKHLHPLRELEGFLWALPARHGGELDKGDQADALDKLFVRWRQGGFDKRVELEPGVPGDAFVQLG